MPIAAKNTIFAKQVSPTEGQKLNTLAMQSQIVLFKAQSVFPFDFFPSDLLIDEVKVTVVERIFLQTAQIRSVAINDMSAVTADVSLFFGCLTLTDRYFSQQPITVKYLFRKDASKARRIIQGLMISRDEKIDITRFGRTSELVKQLETIGAGRINA